MLDTQRHVTRNPPTRRTRAGLNRSRACRPIEGTERLLKRLITQRLEGSRFGALSDGVAIFASTLA